MKQLTSKTNMRRRYTVALVVCLGILAPMLSGGVANAKTTKAKCKSMKTITYATRTQPSDPLFAYWTVADKMGYFKQECIISKIIHLDAGEQAVEAGRVELTVSGADVMLGRLAAENGKPSLIAFFSQVPQTHLRIATLAGSPINTLQDMRGKTIATLSNAFSGTSALKAELKLVGIDPEKDVKIVIIPAGPAAVNALVKGDVDVLNYVDSQVVQFEQLLGKKLKIIPPLPAVGDSLGPVWVARAADFQKNKKVFTGYIRAYLKGYLFLNTNLRAAAAIEVKKFPGLIQAGHQSEEEAINAFAQVIGARNQSAQLPPTSAKWATPRLVGWNYLHSWQSMLSLFPDLPSNTDVSKAYTNELIKSASVFDRAAVIKAAKAYKF